MMATNKRHTPSQISGNRLSMAMENYLLSLFHMEEMGTSSTSSQLAKHLKLLPASEGLGTSLPSVSGMIRRMVREDLIKKTSSKELMLTLKGRDAAESIVRRHRLAERMVVDIFGIELQNAHAEAHRLEHAISPELENKISETLGHPSTCPFGHPIPRNGYVAPKSSFPLSNARSGQTLILDQLPEDDQALLQYFVSSQMTPDQLIEVVELAPFRGIIKLSCNNKDVVISYAVAEKIKVRKQ